MSGRFAGRRAVVTGGAAGIGLTVAQRIVAEGGQVAIWDRDAERATAAAETLGGIAIALDIADWPAVEQAAAETAQKLGGIDILVASAGITGPNATLEDYPPDAWRKVFDVNVHGLFHCDKAVVPFMRAGGYGRIVNIASVAGKEGNPNASAYSASKAAVIGLTKSLGKELATTGITVNCVTPAAVKTAIFDQMSEAHIAFMLSKIPIGRFGTVDEVASLVCWLASEECSFTTSAVFDISGGRATY
jgi:NAD(P)-dependent dehydrogenase (short-subunit alcohol dehydrogenase family)